MGALQNVVAGATQTRRHMFRPRKAFITNPSTLGDVRDLAFSDYAFAALLEDGHVTTWGLAVCSLDSIQGCTVVKVTLPKH